jgi:flagellar biosynthetic protein FliQ
MGVGEVMGLFKAALQIAFVLAGPVLGAGLVAGLIVSIFQAVTQINEMTLTFIPKIIAVVACLALLLPWMLQRLMGFTIFLFENAASFGSGS